MTDTFTTIRDLQNARHVLANNGHTKGTFIMPGTAAVCLEGAIRLATVSELRTSRPVACHQIYSEWMADLKARPRFEAAIQALTRVLPEVCPAVHGEFVDDFLGEDTPSIRVWHFNDHVCDGAQEADLVLEQAIEKLQADL